MLEVTSGADADLHGGSGKDGGLIALNMSNTGKLIQYGHVWGVPCGGAGGSLEQGCAVQVLDSLITSLAKHTSLLNPAMPQASIAFGADELACMATETMFELANRCATAQTALCPPLLDTARSFAVSCEVRGPACMLQGLGHRRVDQGKVDCSQAESQSSGTPHPCMSVRARWMARACIRNADKLSCGVPLCRYGDSVRVGWKTIMDVVMRLYRLGQLPASVAALEGEDSAAAAMRLPRLATSRSAAAAPSLLSRAFLRCAPLPERQQDTGMLGTESCSGSSMSQAEAVPVNALASPGSAQDDSVTSPSHSIDLTTGRSAFWDISTLVLFL